MEPVGIKSKNSIPTVELDATFELRELEQRLAEYVGTERCVLTSSGTAGLLTALRASGIRDGDAVMCTSFSFFATAEIIMLAGAVPVLVDTNPNTFNIDPYCIEYVVKKCARTRQPLPKALIAADSFGLPCDFDAIEDICRRYNITLIEDMSEAFGASYKGRKCGSFGRFSVASFFPARPLGGIGDGGGIFCRNRDDARILEMLRRSGEKQPFGFVEVSLIGEKLTCYSDELSSRHLVAARYKDNFDGFVKVQQVDEDYISAYTQFVILLADSGQRDKVMDMLKEKHIPCSILRCTQRGHGAENEWEKVVLANTKQAAQRLLSIPMHPHLSVHVVDYISECIMETVDGNELPPEEISESNTEGDIQH